MFWKQKDTKTAELETRLLESQRQTVRLLDLSYRQKRKIRELEQEIKEIRAKAETPAQEEGR